MNIPKNIIAIQCMSTGGSEVFKLVTRPMPKLKKGEVLLKVEAAGINRADILQRKGKYPPPPGASDILGLEVSGRVVALDTEVVQLQKGDAVCALITGGGYANYCVAAANLCLPLPRNVSMDEGAALPEALFTVWDNVFERGKLRSGEMFLLHGGTSGIGTYAIQLANAMQSQVIATAGSETKCFKCLELGALAAINYRTEDFVARIKELTKKAGVNLILDMVGGDYLPRNIECLASEGRLVQIAVQHGSKAVINLLSVMTKRLTITGSTLRSRNVKEKSKIAYALKEKVWPLIECGKIKPVIYKSYKLEQAAEAHQLMESGEHIGKIILTMP